MPIYEYRCRECARVSSFFVRSIGGAVNAVCAHCRSRDMEKRMSSFAQGRTVASVHESYAPGSEQLDPAYYQDPRNIGRNVEATFARHGMEVPPAVRENIDAARSGETPKGMDL